MSVRSQNGHMRVCAYSRIYAYYNNFRAPIWQKNWACAPTHFARDVRFSFPHISHLLQHEMACEPPQRRHWPMTRAKRCARLPARCQRPLTTRAPRVHQGTTKQMISAYLTQRVVNMTRCATVQYGMSTLLDGGGQRQRTLTGLEEKNSGANNWGAARVSQPEQAATAERPASRERGTR